MKIIVNQNATKQRLIDSANKIVEIAKQKASEGIHYFDFPKIEGVDSSHLISKVIELTEGTVYCGYRGLGQYYIRFIIKS